MAAKRKSFVQRELRRNLHEFVLENKWYLLVLLAVYPLTLLLGRLLGGQNGYLRGFLEGAMLVIVLGAAALLFLLHTEALQQLAGAKGEDATRDQIEKARRRGHIYGAVDNIELDRADVDNLVIASRGVLAIETKWHFRRVQQRNLHYDLDAARRAAQKARSALRSLGEPQEVTPLLVMWGKARHYVAVGGEIHADVHVVDGAELVDWLAARGGGPVNEATARRILGAVQSFAATHGPPRTTERPG